MGKEGGNGVTMEDDIDGNVKGIWVFWQSRHCQLPMAKELEVQMQVQKNDQVVHDVINDGFERQLAAGQGRVVALSNGGTSVLHSRLVMC